ncbi:MAG TPA: CvpA family protein, partial [Chitinophagaceae bacterium]|nr:CvpA family protein [Chitinophagaceae bacterium]
MFIDIAFAIVMILAVVKGLSKGFVVAIFSLLAFFIGLAAALKLSALVAVKLQESTNISGKWLPVLSFLLVFIAVVLLVRLGARAIDKAVQFVWLGWVNRLLGVVLYVILYTTIFSIFMFYAVQLNLIRQDTIDSSRAYGYIQPWGPYVINSLGKILPWFKDLFV